MPGEDATGYGGQDLYPKSLEDHDKLKTWCLDAFIAADADRRDREDKWLRDYKAYRSWVRDRKKGEWRSRVFIPISFWVVETIAPRLVAQLPKFVCAPVGPEDVETAKVMETLLEYSAKQSNLYVQLVDAIKSSLIYGTGIMKTYYDEVVGFRSEPKPVMKTVTEMVQEPLDDPENPGMPLIGLDGEPVINEREEEYEIETGEYEMVQVPVTKYGGPFAKTVDVFHFWIAPEAQDIQEARYVIHRSYRPLSYIKEKIKEGVYKWPDWLGDMGEEIFATDDDPHAQRLREVGLGGSEDPTRKDVELLEYHTDDGRLITVANRKAVIRVDKNPFNHGEKPFVAFPNYKVPHEFWGISELHSISGLQDLSNALRNQRIDNIRVSMDKMYAVNIDNLEDPRDLNTRPGGVVRTKGDMRPDEIIHPIDFGNVTQEAFAEAEMTEQTIEKVTGVSGLQMGVETSSLNDTATGMAILQEQGASRFGLKTKLAELIGYKRLGFQFGSIIQQFANEQTMVRMLGPAGQYVFQTFDPIALQGAIDYDIDPSSAVQTETIRREQALSLLQVLSPYLQMGVDPTTGMPMPPSPGVLALLNDVLEAFGKEDKQRYLAGMMPDPMMMQMMQAQQTGMQPQMGQPQLPQQAGGYQEPEQYPGQNLAEGAVIEASNRFTTAQQI